MILGILMFISFIIFITKIIGLKKAAEYHILIDVIFTALAVILLGNTLGGLTAAVAAGLLLSIFFWIVRKYIPTKHWVNGERVTKYPKHWKIYI